MHLFDYPGMILCDLLDLATTYNIGQAIPRVRNIEGVLFENRRDARSTHPVFLQIVFVFELLLVAVINGYVCTFYRLSQGCQNIVALVLVVCLVCRRHSHFACYMASRMTT